MMDLRKLFIEYMGNVTNIALATAAGNRANVRIVSIGFDETTPDTVYFTTFSRLPKLEEIEENPKVCFVPLPDKEDTEISVRIYGTAAPAELTLEQVARLIGRNLPDYAAQLPMMAEQISLMQIKYESAEVSMGMNDPEVIKL